MNSKRKMQSGRTTAVIWGLTLLCYLAAFVEDDYALRYRAEEGVEGGHFVGETPVLFAEMLRVHVAYVAPHSVEEALHPSSAASAFALSSNLKTRIAFSPLPRA